MTENALAAIELTDKAIAQINTVDDAREFVKKLDTLKKLLKAADMYEQKVKEYARLEVAALVRIVELGLWRDSAAHKSKRYKAMEWIAGMSDEERTVVVAECGERGLLLEELWHQKVEIDSCIKDMRFSGGCAVARFREDGVVNLNDYLIPDKNVPTDVYEGFKDVIRNKIRKFGGHGVGDGNGLYVSTEKAADYADEVLDNKVKSIICDLMRLMSTARELYRIAGGNLPEVTIERERRPTYDFTDESLVNLMLCFMGYAKPRYIDTDESAAKGIANLLDKIGWPAKKIISTIEDEYAAYPYRSNATYMIGEYKEVS